ncbi:hypothetical protein PoB_006645200 [Plakobranchus ocellatus]|uniref:Uncharacterized protein n=1 Tax=Plakobranchus ocellatus TaxID=259542 RepID=A0AAV4D6U1_9GAST|nr:hypothetical protein PoB_006645200 [Plakobranchus ocellatus]
MRKDKERQGRTQISQGLNFVKEFLDRLPKMPSHYCRKDTHKLYLEPMFQSYADIYREYSSVCEAESKTKMSRTVFVGELKASNISIFVPRKDQCDLCCEFSQGNADETEYNQHRERKEYAQTEKAKDKEAYGHDGRTKVLCVDVRRVLLASCLKASALYYKTKLQVHNYTVFDMTSKDVVCFVWNEVHVEGGLNASEFASCLVSYLEGSVDSFDKAIIYSDGCTYQNRNRVLATALRFFCVRYGKTVEQKILERGHTQMEDDSVHATIVRRLKNMDIFAPLDYVNLIKVSRMSPRPYDVRYLTFDFFRDFEKIEEGAIKSIKPSKEANVTNICAFT